MSAKIIDINSKQIDNLKLLREQKLAMISDYPPDSIMHNFLEHVTETLDVFINDLTNTRT